MPHDLIKFGAIFFCGLALIPSAAHALELLNKVHLSKDEYFVAQKLYRGWQRVAPIVILALVFTGMLVFDSGSRGPWAQAAAVIALLSIVATQGIFWAFIYPANRATRNWTQAPPNWEVLRHRWESAHASCAVLNLVAFAGAIFGTL
jgi:hypothetical protein